MGTGIDAQNVGVAYLKKFNPTRYGSLEVGPTGDALSYDIYAAAIKAIRATGPGRSRSAATRPTSRK